MSISNENVPGKISRRWLGPTLLLSVALNLFLIGLLAVPFFMGPPDVSRGHPRGHLPSIFHESLRDLPKEDRIEIRKVMMGHFHEIRPRYRDMNEAKLRLANVLASEPYDEAAARAAFEEVDGIMAEIALISRNAMLTGFASLSPEQRQRVAAVMREEHERISQRQRERDERRAKKEREDKREMPAE